MQMHSRWLIAPPNLLRYYEHCSIFIIRINHNSDQGSTKQYSDMAWIAGSSEQLVRNCILYGREKPKGNKEQQHEASSQPVLASPVAPITMPFPPRSNPPFFSYSITKFTVTR